MQTAVAIRSAWLRSAAFSTLTALALIAPTAAEAGCKLHRVTSTNTAGLARLSEMWALGQSVNPGTPDPAHAPVPCSGALCSGIPAAPAEPMVVPVDMSGQWAILSVPLDALALESDHFPSDETDSLPSFCGLAVFHPPRLSGPASA
ncbi:hypothetical protein [Aquisphaera insulae]|uniref:hypothetical protein n=1 Tax=Aquisphaera insulae TaxID=2712864 RepID=UPI0013ED2731|nr:hypothetical protein [Aquisphaera insulae]